MHQMTEMPDVVFVRKISGADKAGNPKKTLSSVGPDSPLQFDVNGLKRTEYLRAEPVKDLLKMLRGKLNASNYLGMHDEPITAIDKFLEGK